MSLALLRPGVLAGRVIAVAGGAEAIAERCAALGGDMRPVSAALLDEAAVSAWVAHAGPVDVLIADADAPFRAAGGGLDGLRVAVDGAWNVTRALAKQTWIPAAPAGAPAVLFVAPRPGAGAHATAVGAALENTARTLSTEWARFGILVSAVQPGDATTADELSELVAYLASPAGAYYSGTALTLGLV